MVFRTARIQSNCAHEERDPGGLLAISVTCPRTQLLWASLFYLYICLLFLGLKIENREMVQCLRVLTLRA